MSTKKIRVLLVCLLILAGLSTTAYLAVDKIKTNEENQQLQENLSLNLFSFDSDTVTAVDIRNADGNFQVETVDGNWAVTDTDYPYAFELNAYYINSICSYMSNLTAVKKISVTQENLGNYGLADPAVVTCYDQSGAAYMLYIGNASATKEYYYAMLPGDTTVYEIAFTTGDVLRGGIAYLRSAYLLHCYDVNIQEFQLKQEENTIFHFRREDTTWEMLAPLEQAQVHAANINSFLTTLTRLETESFVTVIKDGSELRDYQLDHPAYQLTIRTYDGETMTIDFAPFRQEDTSVYLVCEETGQIATISTGSLGFLQTQPSELLSDKVYAPDFQEVAELAVEMEEIQFTMSMQQGEAGYMLNGISISEQGDSIISLFQSLFKTVSNISYDILDIDADIDADIDINTDAETTDADTNPDEKDSGKDSGKDSEKNSGENSDSAFTTVYFRYTLSDGTQQEVALVPIDETYYQAYLNGEYTHKIVRRRALSGSTGVLTYYEKITDALAEAGVHMDGNPENAATDALS